MKEGGEVVGRREGGRGEGVEVAPRPLQEVQLFLFLLLLPPPLPPPPSPPRRFVERNGEEDYLEIIPGDGGCYAIIPYRSAKSGATFLLCDEKRAR